MRKAMIRSITVIVILSLVVASGLIYDKVCHELDKKQYPREYSQYVTKYAAEYGVPENIIYSVIKVESDFVSNAVSHAGAVGLMQITPDTCDWIAFRLGETTDNGLMYDPETNIKYGTYLLSYLSKEFGAIDTVFAAYNAGVGRVSGWLENSEYTDENGVLVNIPFPETENYIKKVNAAIEKYTELYYSSENKSEK